MADWQLLLTDARIATLAADAPGYGEIDDAALAIADGSITWIGRRDELPEGTAEDTRSLSGKWLTPALIDCHTHLVFAGDRAAEFEQRLEGALQQYDADVVFLGVGALGSQTEDYRETYWKESIERVAPKRVVPIHWDSLTGPAEGPFTGMVRAAGLLSKGADELRPFLEEKAQDNPDIEFLTLPRFEPVVLF